MVQKISCAITFGIVALGVWSGLALPVDTGIDETTDVLRRDLDKDPEITNLDARVSGAFWADSGLVSRGEKVKRKEDPRREENNLRNMEEYMAGHGRGVPPQVLQHMHDHLNDPQAPAPPLRPRPGALSTDTSASSLSGFSSSSDSDPEDEGGTFSTPEGSGRNSPNSKGHDRGREATDSSGSGGGPSGSGSGGGASGSGSGGRASGSGSGGGARGSRPGGGATGSVSGGSSWQHTSESESDSGKPSGKGKGRASSAGQSSRRTRRH